MTTPSKHAAIRRRRELRQGPGSTPLKPVIDARRRLSESESRSVQGINADLLGPREIRYAYLTQSHD